jgi:hypothetical protein
MTDSQWNSRRTLREVSEWIFRCPLTPGNALWRAVLRAAFPLVSRGWKTGQRFLDLKLPQMMVQMLIHQRRPFQRSQRSEKEVRMLRAYRRPARRKAVDEFAQP